MSLDKLAETIEMSIDIPESDKKIAARAVLHFEKVVRKITAFNKHLNVMYNPFKEYQEVSQESVVKYRSAVWQYLKQIRENFENLRDVATLCVRDLSHFSTDTHITELISTFTDDFGDIEDQVISLLHVLANWDHPAYQNNIISAMENLKKETAEIRKLIYDRIIDHINTNILVKNWVDEVDDDLSSSIKEREPLISRLYREREKKVDSIIGD